MNWIDFFASEWIEIIFKLGIILIGFYLAFFKSYFKEKGKNLATIEDIESITRKIESVKDEFVTKNAEFKASLDFLTNLKFNHKNEERLALIDFSKKLFVWKGLFCENIPVLPNEYNNDDIQNKEYSYNLEYQNVMQAKAILHLYVEDQKLFELIDKFYVAIFTNFYQNSIVCLAKLRENNKTLDLLREKTLLEKEINPNELDGPALEKYENLGSYRRGKYNEFSTERLEIIKEYQSKMIEGLKLTNPLEIEYLGYFKNYMKTFF